jgi:hypothetical protein
MNLVSRTQVRAVCRGNGEVWTVGTTRGIRELFRTNVSEPELTRCHADNRRRLAGCGPLVAPRPRRENLP